LSATIQNSSELLNEFQEIYPNQEIYSIEYNQRFMNQQRWIWDSETKKIERIHPCVCFNRETIKDFNEISFTPNDLVVLYEKIEDSFEDKEDIGSFSPDNTFTDNYLLTLDDSKKYEQILKQKLYELSQKYPTEIDTLINEFTKEYPISKEKNDFIPLFQKCQKMNLLPMILFHTKEEIVQEMFQLIELQLREEESREFPFHYQILEKKNQLYEEYYEKRKTYEMGIKIKTKDPFTEKIEKMDTFDTNEKDKYIQNMKNFYHKCILKCKDTENEKNKIHNLTKEMTEFIQNPDFRKQDIFRKHPRFCFTNNEPMSGDEIRTIRKEVAKTTGKKIEYENPLFQLLKRGIGVYIQSNPDEYNWIVQRLMSQKKLAIVLSDKTLCLGIDLPIRTSCFTGYKDPDFTKEDYLQMSGRAGRRGLDNQGNIIFHNIVNYKELMKGKLTQLKFTNKELHSNYSVITQLNPKIKTNQLKILGDLPIIDPKKRKLIWYLRYYENSFKFVDSLENYEKQLFMIYKSEREYCMFSYLLEKLLTINNPEYLLCYKQNKVPDNLRIDFFKVGNICKDICNSLHPIKYKFIVENCKIIFHKFKNILELW
jgi:superfamily II RNA helicase